MATAAVHDRISVINEVVRHIGGRNYLEIGVFLGECFLEIEAPQMVAVDPCFQIPGLARRRSLRERLFGGRRRRYIEKTSDVFFREDAPGLYRSRKIDVAFIDGLHTYQQSWRDVQNTLSFLDDRGVIIMHDCSPPTAAAAHPAASLAHAKSLGIPGFTGEWCGDVWKTVLRLRAEREDLRTFVLDCDYGLGVVLKRPALARLELPTRDLDALTYDDLDRHRREWLDLREPEALFRELGTPAPQLVQK